MGHVEHSNKTLQPTLDSPFARLPQRCTSRSRAAEHRRYDALDSKSQTYAAARVELSDLRLPSERIRTA